MFQNEKIIQTKICKHCNTSFEITDKDLEFYEKISPVFNGKKYLIPTPTLCPDCRQQRRLTFRNERKLYKRKSDLSGKEIISIYSPDKPYKVYSQEEWWSDKWNALDYGKDFDFNKGFFEQFDELQKKIPKIGLYVYGSTENSLYSNYGQFGKNLYLCVNCYELEDSFYSTNCFPFLHKRETFCVDCEDCLDSSYIYECYDTKFSNNCFYSGFLEGCSKCYFSNSLVGCQNCICCVNLANKKFMILNKEVNKEEFEKVLQNMLTKKDFKNEMLQKFQELKKNLPVKSSQISNCENVSGDYLTNCKNVFDSYVVGTTENGKFMYTSGYNAKNIYDCMNSGGYSDGVYESHYQNRGFKVAFIIDVDDSKNCYYCLQCYNSSNLFACIGLRNKQYCIFNKQYTKEEYEILVPKIIEYMQKTGEYGEFFPSSISPFGYNEVVVNEYFPLTKEEALKQGFNWCDYESPIPKVDKIIPGKMLPDDINKIPDDVLNRVIKCEITGRPFLITKQELEFYRKHNIPIPKRHPDQRHEDRMRLRNPRKLFNRKCDKCGKEIKTTYNPERPEIVYCEECYNKEVY